MLLDFITVAGFILAIFVFGISVGKLVCKIERFLDKQDDKKNVPTHKNDRR